MDPESQTITQSRAATAGVDLPATRPRMRLRGRKARTVKKNNTSTTSAGFPVVVPPAPSAPVQASPCIHEKQGEL